MIGQSTLLTALLGSASASVANMNRQIRQGAAQMGFRNLGAVGDVADLNNYGCWCYFEENPNGQVERTGIGYGKSNPVNAYDAACKKLSGAYECVIADQAAAGQSCEPWTVAYNAPTNILLQAQGALAACNSLNTPGSCAALACIVERDFVSTYLDLVVQGVPKQLSTFQHAQGFDQAGSGCPISPGTANPSTACCGAYPDRFPYKTLNGARQCCEASGVGITYMQTAWDCCSDGVGPNGCPGE